ncbi:hypothetical protein MKW92_012969 [Papaver armeniacum]|nr:hypothetical protein MKW92_012969 [Papaver armeniacum]
MDNKIKLEEDVDKPDWRLSFSSESRQKIVAKVEENLWKCISNPSPDKFQEIKDAAAKFEAKMFSIATSTEDYVRRITTKMLKVNKTTPTGEASSLPSNSSCGSQITDSASHSVQSQVRNQSKSSPVPMANQSQPTQQRLLLNNMENSMSSPGIQNSGNLVSLPLGTCLTDNSVSNSLGQSCEMQITPGMSQTQNTFSNSQRQVHERQHLQQVVAQQHQQSQNQNQFVFQQQFQHPGMTKHRGNIQTHSMHLHDAQQQQHNLMQPIQTSSSQQQTQSPMVQSATQTGVVQNQQSSALQQHSQSVQWQQQSQRSLHEQQTSMAQPIMLSSQQKQQLMGKQTDERNFQHNQPFGQPNSTMELQKQQRQKWLGQQTNSSSMQHQQQVMSQQNDISRFHQQTLGLQGNVSGLKQQQQFGNQSGVSNMQTHQQSMHSLHQAKSATHQQSQQTSSMLLSSPGKQAQSSRQQLMAQSQQQKQMQQQLALENKSNSFQRGALQHQNSSEWQRQLLQLQQGRLEASSTSTDTMGLRGYSSVSGDVQDEVLNKVKFMMETYLPQLNEIVHRINIKLQQAKPEDIDILKRYKEYGEKCQHFLRMPLVGSRQLSLEKLIPYEKQILSFISMPNLRKVLQLPGQQLSQSQMAQLKHQHNNQMINKSQMQSRILRNPQPATMHQNAVATMHQHGSMSLSNQVGISSSHPSNMINSLQHNPALESGQGNCLTSSQQGGASVGGPMQKSIINVSQQAANLNTLSQNNMSLLPPNMIQHQQSRQQQDHNMTSQQHQRQLMHQSEQHILKNQQLQRQQKLQPTHSLPLPQHHTQMSEIGETKVRSNILGTTIQQHITPSQDAAMYNHRQIKAGSRHVSSPQLLQAGSPQISQNSSSLIDHQNMLTSLRTPLQSVNSPSVCLSPSTPVSSSPLPGKPEKQTPALSSLSNAGNIGQAPTQVSSLQQIPQSISVGTPGISASPLLEDFINAEGNQDAGTAPKITPEKPVLTPTERLLKAVKSISSKALSASVDDIGLAVSMVDGFAGSRPGEGARYSVPEDLVAMAGMHVKAMNFDLINDSSLKKKLKRCYSTESSKNAMPSDYTENDSSKKINGSETSEQLRSTATSGIKRSRLEMGRALQEEIGEINYRLINTVLDISNEDMNLTSAVGDDVEGRIVNCTFHPIGSSAEMFPVLPIRFLVSANYPYCSPTLIDKLSGNQSNEYENLLTKATTKFNTSLRCMSEPISLKEMAKSWDSCANAVFLEYARQNGGGSFSSRYGTWEKCVDAV